MAQALIDAQNNLLWEQAYSQQKFHYYRNGIPGYHISLRNILIRANAGDAYSVARRADINNRSVNHLPRQAAYGFTQAHSARLKAVAVPQRETFESLGGKAEAPVRPEADTQVDVKENLNNFRNLLRATFSYIKCLGWGGEGIVTLWRYRPSPDRARRVVMKASVRAARDPASAAQDINKERDMLTVSTAECDHF